MSYRVLASIALGGLALSLSACAGPLEPNGKDLDARVDLMERSIARQWHTDSLPERGEAPAASPSDADPNVLDPDADLPDLLAYAALHNAGLEAAFARWRAALHKLPQVRALPDPRFTYGVFINEVETRVGPQQHRLAIAQSFPWFGTLDLRESAAARAADAAYARYQGTKLDLFRRVKDIHYRRADLEREIAITGENIDLLRQLESIVLKRYRVGAANHADVIRSQIQLEKLADELSTLEDRRRPLAAELNAALNRPANATLPEGGALPRERLDVTTETVHRLSLAHNPALQEIEEKIEQGRVATKLARLKSYPDITLGVDYIVTGSALNPTLPESGDDAVMASISVNLPLWQEKNDASVRQAIAARYATVRAKQDLERQLSSRIESSLHEYRTAQRQIALYRDTLIPKAHQSLEAMLSAYVSTNATFLDVLEAQHELLELELIHVGALSSRARAMARLDALAGTELPRTSDLQSSDEASSSS